MENQEINLTLKLKDINVIMQCLGNGPFVQVNDIINAIKDQAQPQLAAAQPAEEATAE